MTDHRGAFFAVNRTDGKEKWRMTWDPIPGVFNYGIAFPPPAVYTRLILSQVDWDAQILICKAQGLISKKSR